ncbi:MAG: DUF2249 domain-containing protein [Weeksellaceae bacterium]|jgi:uncharacterized protein (DUF2249 family)|nr:DUF2249 domain-containing protein [Weeksellaceae bacterium]
MLINENTKISKLLKENPEALEAIVALSPDFKKLRNPLLRRLMAARTTIGMAAKIGKVKPEDFFNALAPLGFEVDKTEPADGEPSERKPLPPYLKSLSSQQIVVLDVREMIADGKDPLRPIQEKVKELEPGQALNIINSFEPAPLISLLERQGFQSFVDQIDEEQFETYFYREDGDTNNEIKTENTSNANDWDEILKKFEGNMREIDVRHLEMPMPMMSILENLDTLPEEQALFVKHKKIPVFLLTELKDREYEYRINDVQEGEVYLIIFKKK